MIEVRHSRGMRLEERACQDSSLHAEVCSGPGVRLLRLAPANPGAQDCRHPEKVGNPLSMPVTAKPCTVEDILPWRERYRSEMTGQIVHDSIHRRPGWTTPYFIRVGEAAAGYGLMAVAGPWADRPTLLEYYLLPEYRSGVFACFDALLATSGARFIECQSNAPLLPLMLHAVASNVVSEKIVFQDKFPTSHPAQGTVLQRTNSEEESRRSFESRQGGTEWQLIREGAVVATGGVLFHYNPPYGDIFMETAEPFRRRGLGAYFVQELKRICYEMGGIPGARCDPANIASRQTIQKAGFVPFAHILVGEIASVDSYSA